MLEEKSLIAYLCVSAGAEVMKQQLFHRATISCFLNEKKKKKMTRISASSSADEWLINESVASVRHTWTQFQVQANQAAKYALS